MDSGRALYRRASTTGRVSAPPHPVHPRMQQGFTKFNCTQLNNPPQFTPCPAPAPPHPVHPRMQQVFTKFNCTQLNTPPQFTPCPATAPPPPPAPPSQVSFP